MQIFIILILMLLTSMCLISCKDELPVIEIPSEVEGDTVVIFISGDIGWTAIHQELSGMLTSRGMYVIGFNSRKYFWHKRTPEETALAVDNIITNYSGRLHRSRFLLLGYSFGADVVPFVINRLSEQSRSKIAGAAMLSISQDTQFEVSYKRWFVKGETGALTLPEIEKAGGTNMLFIGGEHDGGSVIPLLDRNRFDVVIIGEGHFFRGRYSDVFNSIMKWNSNLR